MIVVDTSVMIALLLREDEAAHLSEILWQQPDKRISASSIFETLMVIEGRTPGRAAVSLTALLELYDIEIEPFAAEHARLAHDAFIRFGKGRHPAKLNFGDCMAYALAKALDAPLLFKGDDFALTDIVPAV